MENLYIYLFDYVQGFMYGPYKNSEEAYFVAHLENIPKYKVIESNVKLSNWHKI